MDWQQLIALIIVAGTAGLFVLAKFRRRQFAFGRDTHCGCSSAAAPYKSMTICSRRGERPKITIQNH
jgi:hypothetical protein